MGNYGTAAQEVMATGRPVCAFIDEVYCQHIDYAAEIPVINITREGIAGQLKYLLDHKADLPAIGESGRKFVEKHHDVGNVTDRLIGIYQKMWGRSVGMKK